MVLESKQERIRKQQLIRKYSRLLLGIPFLFLIAFLLALYVGEFRPSLIRKYNKAAKEWSENGIAAFANQHFYAKSSSGTLPMIETTRIDGECYPVRDTCNRYEDPPEGCNLTKALYYASTSLVLNHQGVVYIQRQNYSQIAKIAFKNNITYVLNRSDLNCGLHPERCSTFCNQLHGIWNTTRGLCHIELFIQSICIRVKSVDGTWVLDTDNERRLPANRAFQLYDSDGVGCSYSNNWHSVMYDYRKTSAIPIFVLLLGFADSKVRSTSDSYLFASAYTRGCSSETRAESSCFGETRLVKRHVYCVLFVFTLAVCIIETCLVLFFLLKEKKRTTRSSK
ncbi:hypothetical protein WA577_006742 [Blastocystis sp. JDR]